ncbi:MAG: hypothetical protein PUJ92_06070 [Bacilli bacterium]|nr:hypothetical protein [Bacilli bacterium]MDY5832036.1 hypothetical protein [Candidatus Onthovivens sp.]
MKLEVGMYVRLKREIGKVTRIYERTDGNMVFDIGRYQYYFTEIKKASYNIIDLIEVGDYVNGHRVEEIDFENEEIFTDSEYYCGIVEFCNIKSVITHEQMEQMAYKVVE